jgi:hypothetical protein
LEVVALVAGAVALVAFVVVERHSPEPLIPLHLFGSRNFSGANLMTLLLYAGFGGALFLLPIFLIHTNGELPVAGLRSRVVAAPRPHVERCEVEGRTLYLLAGGAMFNLAAGPGDPYDTFDLVTALMLEATGFLATEGASYPPGVHPLPKKVQDRAARYLLG